jgi:hypothetical protein
MFGYDFATKNWRVNIKLSKMRDFMRAVNNPLDYLDCIQRALAAFLPISCRLRFDSERALYHPKSAAV